MEKAPEKFSNYKKLQVGDGLQISESAFGDHGYVVPVQRPEI